MFVSRPLMIRRIHNKCLATDCEDCVVNTKECVTKTYSDMTDDEVEKLYFILFPEEYHRMVNILRNQCKTQPRRYREEL